MSIYNVKYFKGEKMNKKFVIFALIELCMGKALFELAAAEASDANSGAWI